MTVLLTTTSSRCSVSSILMDLRVGRLPAAKCGTLKGNNMQPHQQRVVDEKLELDKKAHALSDFIGNSPIFETLDIAEQERLKEQNDVMWQYSEILGARIKAFGH